MRAAAPFCANGEGVEPAVAGRRMDRSERTTSAVIIPLEPNLEGLAERRFFSFARQMLDRQAEGDAERISALVESETQRAAGLGELRGQCDEYNACVRVLGDLAQLRWQLVDSGYGLELHSPHPMDAQVSDNTQARRRKEAIRNELRPRVVQQFANPSVRKFIRRAERPPASSGRRRISALIADGAELQERLRAARSLGRDDPDRAAALRVAVQPYLQLVDANTRDEYTGMRLGDIWRYFRYTWSIPQTSIPGRQLHYLVRDAAHESHAVIGIAGLSNCAVQLVPRDRAIGWSAASLTDALAALFAQDGRRSAREASDVSLRLQGVYGSLKTLFPDDADPSPARKKAALERVVAWLLDEISMGIGGIECGGLATEAEIGAPTPEVIARLRALGREFASHRQQVLAGTGNSASDALAADISVDGELLDLEAKHATNAPVHDSRRMLVGKKRALELARLLDARRVLAGNRDALTDPTVALAAMEGEAVRTAINAAMSTVKSRRIGTNMLEMTTCGAVAPYNRMLGGKLVALLMLSPEVSADYLRRYGSEPTIIRSQLKNERVVPDNTLVWLGTTSLFSHGSSQYERLRLPAGVIAEEQQELRYTYLGDTSGYGTVQFADDTVRALEGVLRRQRGYRDVNGVFGEGASPRLRKLRSGLDALGFQADISMLHHQARRIYGVPLFGGAAAYLCGLEPAVPGYVATPDRFPDATERIAEFWRSRWLSSRLAHGESWEALGNTPRWALSSTIPLREPAPPDRGGGGIGGGGAGGDDRRLDFWRRLAMAGSNAVSEGLTDGEFRALHLATPLEDHLLERARGGVSIVLTGNAGDGKTHLARALQRSLKDEAEGFEFAYDATAMMSSDDGVAPIVERWRAAEQAGKRMILAINQYPLYMLRRELPEALPDVAEELEGQWDARLTTGREGSPAAGDSVLVVDLSLRNPLARAFARRVLERMLDDPAVKQHAASGEDPDFSFNYGRLVHSQVQERLFGLFERLISSGRRTTVRELWILTARLLFGASGKGETPGVAEAWYSERLFAADVRFPLADALRGVADPAGVSHPHVDRVLENPASANAGGWVVGEDRPDALPVSALAVAKDERDRDRGRFLALKRRFYFEHSQGGERVFELDRGADSRFHGMLRTPEEDAEHLGLLVEEINRCYFPHRFEGMRDRLCLWVGHRLDEQPTKSFVAGECIPRERLSIHRPAPPGALRNALEYVPDHLLVSASAGSVAGGSHEAALRVDAVLFRTLSAVSDGLPRHLINPGELNRLDTFVDRLRRMEPSRLDEFLVYNAEQVVSSAVKVSVGSDRYLDVQRL